MNVNDNSRKRSRIDIDPGTDFVELTYEDVVIGSDEDINDSNEMYTNFLYFERFSLSVAAEERKSKRIRNAEGGLQMFTKLVCEKLESEKQMSNSDVCLLQYERSRLPRF